MTTGAYVRVKPDADPCYTSDEIGVVRSISADSRIVYVEMPGDDTLCRFAPDELEAA